MTEWIDWTIESWSALPNAFHAYTYSETMQCASHSWCFKVFPGGVKLIHAPEEREENTVRKKYVGIFVRYKGDSEQVRTDFTITLVNQLPGKADRTRGCSEPIKFAQTGMHNMWGDPIFIKSTDLLDESKGWKVNGRVIIRADITTYGELEHTTTTTDTWTPPETLTSDLTSLMTSGTGSYQCPKQPMFSVAENIKIINSIDI